MELVLTHFYIFYKSSDIKTIYHVTKHSYLN